MPERSLLSDTAATGGNVIAFPHRGPVLRRIANDAMISHDGIAYPLNALLRQLPRARRADLLDMGPFPPQDVWSIVMQRWPDLARAAVAALLPAGPRPH